VLEQFVAHDQFASTWRRVSVHGRRETTLAAAGVPRSRKARFRNVRVKTSQQSGNASGRP
jgi:hypothetical protein